MKITKEDIPHIEKALGLKLYEHQVNYLLDEGELHRELQSDKGTGKTIAYCVRIALSEGKVLNLAKPEQFADNWHLKGDERLFYARKVFRGEFISIWCKLSDYRFPVRNVFIGRKC